MGLAIHAILRGWVSCTQFQQKALISGHVFMMTEKMLVCDYTDNNFDDMIKNTVKNMEMIICDNDADWFG